MWKTIKSLGLPGKISPAGKISLRNEKGEITFDSKINANIFKSFFANLAMNLVSKLPPASNRFSKDVIHLFYKNQNIKENSFHFSEVTEDSIFKQLISINSNKAAGMDNISGKFLKEGAKFLALPLSQICNLSIKLSVFPNECKLAKLKPLYKKGSRTVPKNYRPVSLLPIISKVIEKVIHEQVQHYLDREKIIFKYQSGFRKNHSTDTCLSYLTDKILNWFDQGFLTGLIAIDLQKAFDTIDHTILLEKMVFFGFSNGVISWFQSYLADRSFFINLEDSFSTKGDITCGVPQGSILGPLLFLLYINDMPLAVNSEIYLYADDTCLVYQHKSLEVINENLNRDFSNLCEWFVDNKLSIHFGEDKTKCILFGSKRQKNDLNISFKDVKIKQFSKLTYLGGILDEAMKGEDMALYVLKKINSRVKFLYRKDSFLNFDLRRLLCNALIQPHFDYVCSAWFPNLNKNLKARLQTSQNKCIRFCLRLGHRKRLNFLDFKKINWLPVQERVYQCIAAHVFKFFKNNCPAYIHELFSQATTSSINTRHSYMKLTQPFRKRNFGKNNLSFLGPKIWNELPESIKNSNLLNTFKHKVKDHFFSIMENKENCHFIFY